MTCLPQHVFHAYSAQPNLPPTSIFSSGKASADSLKSAVTSSNLETSAFTAAALPPASWMAFTTCVYLFYINGETGVWGERLNTVQRGYNQGGCMCWSDGSVLNEVSPHQEEGGRSGGAMYVKTKIGWPSRYS